MVVAAQNGMTTPQRIVVGIGCKTVSFTAPAEFVGTVVVPARRSGSRASRWPERPGPVAAGRRRKGGRVSRLPLRRRRPRLQARSREHGARRRQTSLCSGPAVSKDARPARNRTGCVGKHKLVFPRAWGDQVSNFMIPILAVKSSESLPE